MKIRHELLKRQGWMFVCLLPLLLGMCGCTSLPEYIHNGFKMAWELDFWGRFRRAIESAEASLDASAADYDDVLVTLLGDVATNYVQMRTTEQRIKYAQENVKLQARTVLLAKAQFDVQAV